MGTNFYAKRKVNPQEKQQLHQKLEEILEGKAFDYEFYDLFEEIRQEIHLGKRSGGWQFLWQHNPEYYPDNLECIKNFLITGDYIILDEYGDSYSWDDFIEKEIGESLKSGLNYTTYMKKYPKERRISKEHMDWITPEGLRFVKGDFS